MRPLSQTWCQHSSGGANHRRCAQGTLCSGVLQPPALRGMADQQSGAQVKGSAPRPLLPCISARVSACLRRQATLGSLPSLDGSDDDATLQHSVPRLLRAVPTALLVFGLLPWDTARRPCFSLSFQWGARLLVALSAVAFILLGLGQFAEEGCSAGTEVCWQRNGFLSQAPLPVGAICVLLLVSLRGQQRALEDTFTLLRGLALERRYQLWRGRQARRPPPPTQPQNLRTLGVDRVVHGACCKRSVRLAR